MHLVSVNVGQVRVRKNRRGQAQSTGIEKKPVTGPVFVSQHGLKGDESAYRSRQLGDTAVHMFSHETYDSLRKQHNAQLPIPTFGENITTLGYTETKARIGDVLQIGSVVLRVCQPVVRCSWPATLAKQPQVTKWITQTGCTGAYLEVIEPGDLETNQTISVLERGHEDFTVSALNEFFLAKTKPQARLAAILNHPVLADRWKQELLD